MCYQSFHSTDCDGSIIKKNNLPNNTLSRYCLAERLKFQRCYRLAGDQSIYTHNTDRVDLINSLTKLSD